MFSNNLFVSNSNIYIYIQLPTPVFLGFPGDSDSKESTCNVENLGLIPGSGGFPGVGHGNPLQYSCLENPHGQCVYIHTPTRVCTHTHTHTYTHPCALVT